MKYYNNISDDSLFLRERNIVILYDNDYLLIPYGTMTQANIKSDDLKTSAKNNTEKDFEFAYYDSIDDILIKGLSQNQDFFTLLLQNEEIKKRVLGIFAGEINKDLRGES